LIAKDLTRMQVWVSVNEADIGQIRAGQPVTFTVDAYPKEVFQGSVNKVRLNATMTQNVVTYTVEVTTDNSDGRLLPYLTANVQFQVGQRENVLRVPNAALRWRPLPQQIAPDARREATGKGRSKGKAADNDAAEQGMLWVADGAFVRPLRVRVGASDGVQTEVEGEGLDEGIDIVIGENRQTDTSASSNP